MHSSFLDVCVCPALRYRYLKLRRGIPQSPWFIDGERKGEGSVQVQQRTALFLRSRGACLS